MKLTEEQKVILDKVIKGKTNIVIGNEMGYARDTIKIKVRAIIKKFHVNNRLELVREAVILRQKGLL